GYKYDITVLHDDAFVINRKDGSSVALEPSYFDKSRWLEGLPLQRQARPRLRHFPVIRFL
ncbi:hypothetical protein WP50_09315, partial [Lactiplantibacillus plantarum]